MWIKINNKPICIADIKTISPVIKCDGKWYMKQFEYREFDKSNVIYYVENALGLYETLTTIERHNKIRKYLDEHPVYIFIVYYNSIIQRFLNGNYNGVGNMMNEMHSRVYENESAAITAQEHLLCEINEIEKNLINIQI